MFWVGGKGGFIGVGKVEEYCNIVFFINVGGAVYRSDIF